MSFDPNSTASADSGLFGLPFSRAESKMVLLPVPWEATTSYGGGTAQGPGGILGASHQVDLFDIELGDFYRHGLYLEDIPAEIENLNMQAKNWAKHVVTAIEVGEEDQQSRSLQMQVNEASHLVNRWVYEQSKLVLREGKFLGVVGGDHSVPEGAIRALSEKLKGDFGILHLDAHADLREAYQGFRHSHASIMYNVMQSEWAPQKLVQVGIRDFSQGEFEYIQKNNSRITSFFDTPTKRRQHRGETWQSLCDQMVQALPSQVYLSFDIDGLSAEFCSHTGTPVPGGLSFSEVCTLLATVVESGRKIVGLDLCEVSPGEDEWDANVGARLLYKMCGWLLVSQGVQNVR